MTTLKEPKYTISYKLSWKFPTQEEIYFSDPLTIDGHHYFDEATILLDKHADEEVYRLLQKGLVVLEVTKSYKLQD